MANIFDGLKERAIDRVNLIKNSLSVMRKIKTEKNEEPNKEKSEFYPDRQVNVKRSNGEIEVWKVKMEVPGGKVLVVDQKKGIQKLLSSEELRNLNPKFNAGTSVKIQRSNGAIEANWIVEFPYDNGDVSVISPDGRARKTIPALKLKELNS